MADIPLTSYAGGIGLFYSHQPERTAKVTENISPSECSIMNKRVGQVIVKVWVAAAIAVVAATAGANPLSTSNATSQSIVGTIVPAERVLAVQPGPPNVRLAPMRSSQATPPTQRANQPSADGTSQAADAAANQAATLGPRGCSGCMRSAAAQASNQAANQAATLGPVCGGCGRAAPPQAATQAANQSANQAATLGPHGPGW